MPRTKKKKESRYIDLKHFTKINSRWIIDLRAKCKTKKLLLLSHFSHVRLCDPIDVSPPGSSVPGILQARILEWVDISFPPPMHACILSHFSRVRLCVTLWTAAHQAPLSTGFSRQEYWSWLLLPCPSPKKLEDNKTENP